METLERLPQATMLSSTMSFPEKAIYYPGREAQTYINLPLPNVYVRSWKAHVFATVRMNYSTQVFSIPLSDALLVETKRPT